jgi:hypothetical protein
MATMYTVMEYENLGDATLCRLRFSDHNLRRCRVIWLTLVIFISHLFGRSDATLFLSHARQQTQSVGLIQLVSKSNVNMMIAGPIQFVSSQSISITHLLSILQYCYFFCAVDFPDRFCESGADNQTFRYVLYYSVFNRVPF